MNGFVFLHHSCAKCERPFRHGTEDTVTINKKTYHSDCLSCDKCSKPYDGSFSPDELDKDALCRECTHMERTKKASDNQSNNAEAKPKCVLLTEYYLILIGNLKY